MLDFIINPIAGGVDGKKINATLDIIKKILDEKRIEYSFHVSHKKEYTKELTANLIKNGSKTIIAVGGDGTLHEIINGFTDFDKASLGIIPCGTGNDFVASLGIPLNTAKALELILLGEPKYTDFMQMPTVRGLNIIGMGIDVDVLKRYSKKKKKNKFAYTSCLIKTLFNFDYVDFDVQIDGEEAKTNYTSFIACIANGHCYGGGIPICPPAKSDDKILDFVAVDKIKKLKIIGAFLKLKKGKLLTLPQASHKNMKKIKVFPKGDYTVNVDGELYDNIPFEVEIVSDKLRVYRP